MNKRLKCTGKGHNLKHKCGRFNIITDKDIFYTEDHSLCEQSHLPVKYSLSFECKFCNNLTDIEEISENKTSNHLSYIEWNHNRLFSKLSHKI